MRENRTFGYFTKEHAEKLIPRGCYCYDDNGLCPFWDKFTQRPAQQNGYCHWLRTGDLENEGISLLWDQCKECGVNEED